MGEKGEANAEDKEEQKEEVGEKKEEQSLEGAEEQEEEELEEGEEYEDETEEEEEDEDEEEESSDDESVPEPPPPNPFNEEYFQRKILDREPSKLSLNGQQLKRAGAFYLSEALKQNTSITSLRLCDNGLGVGGGKVLAEFIPHNTTLKRLDIMQNHIGEEGTRRIAEALVEGSGLEEIYGIDLSPYQHDVFRLRKSFSYEYGNIQLLRHLKVNRRFIVLEREQQEREAAAAREEEERLAREREEEEDRRRQMSMRSSFANAASGALSRVSGLWSRRGGSKGAEDVDNGGPLADDDNEGECRGDEHDSVVLEGDSEEQGDQEEQEQEQDEDEDRDASQEDVDDDSLAGPALEDAPQRDADRKAEVKAAKKLKFWVK